MVHFVGYKNLTSSTFYHVLLFWKFRSSLWQDPYLLSHYMWWPSSRPFIDRWDPLSPYKSLFLNDDLQVHDTTGESSDFMSCLLSSSIRNSVYLHGPPLLSQVVFQKRAVDIFYSCKRLRIPLCKTLCTREICWDKTWRCLLHESQQKQSKWEQGETLLSQKCL